MMEMKRVYENPDEADGVRILVDRLWPRGISKEKARIDYWMKEIAPSDNLRRWFGHRPERWEAFKARYLKELRNNGGAVQRLREITKNKTSTLLYAAKDTEKNNASCLLGFLKQR